ncbi:MAG: phosphotransferase [Rhodospirillales bacterium]
MADIATGASFVAQVVDATNIASTVAERAAVAPVTGEGADKTTAFDILKYVGAAFLPILGYFYKSFSEWIRGHRRKVEVVQLLRAEFGHVARHSATNLRRLTELFRSPRTVSESIIVLRKISLRQTDIQSFEALFSAVKMEDLALLPENLSRDAMRIQLITRNIEIDVETAIDELKKYPRSVRYDPVTMHECRARLASLSKTVERCAQDSAELILKLTSYEQTLHGDWAKRQRKAAQDFSHQPIHFDDVTNLREVADWQSWKEEQQLLKTTRISEMVQETLGVDATEVKTRRQFLGTINQISECQTSLGILCVRVRINQGIFQYEKGLIKEAIVASILNRMEKGDIKSGVACDDLIAEIMHELELNEGRVSIEFPMGTDIHFYSTSYAIDRFREFPMIISDWAKGRLLSLCPDEVATQAFKRLGYQVSQLHSLRLKRFYRNFRDLGQYRYSRDFTYEIVKELGSRNEDIGLIPNSIFEPKLNEFEAALNKVKQQKLPFAICHNDIHVNNVVVDLDTPGNMPELSIVDWDNTCVHHPYLDFVKIKYWGTIGDDGRFKEDTRYFQDFCSGYGVDHQEVLASDVFKALSALWLFRVYMFEVKRESGGRRIPEPFPHSKVYKKALQKIFRE